MPRRGAPISDTLHPYDSAEPYLFVSYARRDRELVIPIVQDLVRAGVRLWWDEGLHAGEDFGDGGAASDISAKVPEWHTTRGNYVTTKQVHICIIVLLSKNE